MERSVFEIVKAPLGWSVFADNIKTGGVYESRSAALEAAAQAASDTITDGGGVQINVPGSEDEKPRWAVAFEIAAAISLRKLIDDEWVLGLSGLLSIMFGVLLLARPGAGLVAVGMLIGAFMITVGILAVALSLRLRKISNRLTDARAT